MHSKSLFRLNTSRVIWYVLHAGNPWFMMLCSFPSFGWRDRQCACFYCCIGLTILPMCSSTCEPFIFQIPWKWCVYQLIISPVHVFLTKCMVTLKCSKRKAVELDSPSTLSAIVCMTWQRSHKSDDSSLPTWVTASDCKAQVSVAPCLPLGWPLSFEVLLSFFIFPIRPIHRVLPIAESFKYSHVSANTPTVISVMFFQWRSKIKMSSPHIFLSVPFPENQICMVKAIFDETRQE